MDSILIIPIAGMITGIIIPVAAFIWLYHDEKNKRAAVIEISKNLDDPTQVEELIRIFEERKRQPLDYRRGGIITLFVGLGLFALGLFALGGILQGVGALVGLIGIGTFIAGYLYPNTGKELTDAVENYEMH